MRTVDYLIVGQGLAGSVFAALLLERSRSFVVVDDDHRTAASKAAGGIINPITGKRLNRPSLIGELLQDAFSTYPMIERLLGAPLFTRRNVLRLFTDDVEQRRWEARRQNPQYEQYVSPNSPDVPANLASTYGAFEITVAGQLDIRQFITAFRSLLKAQNRLLEEPFLYDLLRISKVAVEWGDVRAQYVIFCEGYRMTENPYFNAIQLNPAKGEVLTVEAPDFSDLRIVQCGKWILRSLSGEILAGTTYSWDQLDENPTCEAKDQIRKGMQSFCKFDFEISDHRAGVRAVTKADNRPIVGVHPNWPRLAILNGFGSKGALQVPFSARQLLENLEQNEYLHSEIAVCRPSLWK
ncbi:MAG TPA: FAD-dependent oxidoreductase [Chthoniobacterales bacterium]|nr:FAD-dependent oxidoreductase [Chthoniobacterales bacterium]